MLPRDFYSWKHPDWAPAAEVAIAHVASYTYLVCQACVSLSGGRAC